MLVYCYVGSKYYTHRTDDIMDAMSSQITSVSIVCFTVCSGTDKNINLHVTGLCEGESTGDMLTPLTKGQ